MSLEDIKRKVSKAKSLLYLDHPFFGTSVARRPIIYTDTVPTASMSATGQMYMCPAFVAPITVRQSIFLLAHEGLHYMLSHAFRRGTRDHKAFNIAADKVVNDILKDAGVGDPIEGGVYMDGARNFAAEELYDPDDADGPGPGGIGLDVGAPCDDDGKPLDDAAIRQIQTQIKIEIVQAAKAAKAVGKLPGSIARIVDDIVNVTTPWHAILDRFMLSKVRANKSFRRPNKRYVSSGIYLRGRTNAPKMGPIVFVNDTSGSVTESELAFYAGHANRIIETCRPESVTVLYCDARVNHVDEFTPDDYPIKFDFHGGGGTRFKPAFDYIDNHALDPEVVVYFTDGHANDRNKFTTPHETVWLTTDTTDFKWGTVIKFESEVA